MQSRQLLKTRIRECAVRDIQDAKALEFSELDECRVINAAPTNPQMLQGLKASELLEPLGRESTFRTVEQQNMQLLQASQIFQVVVAQRRFLDLDLLALLGSHLRHLRDNRLLCRVLLAAAHGSATGEKQHSGLEQPKSDI